MLYMGQIEWFSTESPNNNKERISQKFVSEQRNTPYERAKEIGESIRMNIDQAGKMKKSTREIETDDLKEKTKARTILKDKWQGFIRPFWLTLFSPKDSVSLLHA